MKSFSLQFRMVWSFRLCRRNMIFPDTEIKELDRSPQQYSQQKTLIRTSPVCHRRLEVERSQQVKEYKQTHTHTHTHARAHTHTHTQVSNKIVINNLHITRERAQFLVKLQFSVVQLLNMSSLKVLLKIIERRFQNSLFRSIYIKKTFSVAICLSFLITLVSYLTCTLSKLA